MGKSNGIHGFSHSLFPIPHCLLLLLLAACSTTAPVKPTRHPIERAPVVGDNTHVDVPVIAPGLSSRCDMRYAPAQEDPATRGNYTRGGLYKPGVADSIPDELPDLDCIEEPVVSDEPRSPIGNTSPYAVLGKKYRVLDNTAGYVERGTASYYGKKFHGRLTSNHEVYNMYAFTAAHKTLPLPSFARVTNLDNGKSVIVRINDRGPFHDGRVIDLSYAAAAKLGYIERGTARVEVRALTPNDVIPPVLADNPTPPALAESAMDKLVDGLPQFVVAKADVPAGPSSQPATDAVLAPTALLQVGSYSSRENAQGALARLTTAGIANATLSDISGNGKPMWRLRVNTTDAEIDALAGRIAALGFGLPQRVKE
jgi:rare lipoprotein A